MTVFRVISGLCLLILVAAMVVDLRIRQGSWSAVAHFLHVRWDVSRDIWGQRKSIRSDHRHSIARRITYLVTLALGLVLGATGFLPILLLGQHVSGVLLVIHVTVAPFFSLALAVLALLWAHRLRMRAGEWEVSQRLLRGQIPEKTPMIRFIMKSGFWLVLLCALPLLLAIILGLFPWFGTEGQEYLRQLHGYSGLALIVVSLVHVYVLMTAVEIPVEQLVKEEHH